MHTRAPAPSRYVNAKKRKIKKGNNSLLGHSAICFALGALNKCGSKRSRVRIEGVEGQTKKKIMHDQFEKTTVPF